MTQNNNTIVENEGKTQSDKLNQICSCIFSRLRRDKPVVAIMRLDGVIGKVSPIKSGLNIESVNTLIEKAFDIKKLQAVAIIVNSPGGSPVQSDLIAQRIMQLSRQKKVPVYTFVEDVAASGGYWLACVGQEIYASRSSIIGSIGVISAGFGFVEAIQKIGVERRVLTQGKNKSVLDPFKPMQQSDVKIITRIQTQIHRHFVDYVKTRRVGKLTQDDDTLFNGEFWSGECAKDMGLIDGIDDVYSFIQRNFGQDIKIEYVGAKKSWIKSKIGLSAQNMLEYCVDHAITHVLQKSENDKYYFH
ncbi:S49 family peptidase [Rickettsiales endosymbiont of Paramecium tredecaurelia]|uniref:S49 family peptidase n=1 Tax=Candidatus Sarmatiella mevalonica TaxID=2770581 RepID=UPI0019221026|nr:S49 family peptidase [Candidatus Sarmatiella mevalonica]MBL3284731.1 S49 family peptidase [Candidatus Sarmatiella mevalonica]